MKRGKTELGKSCNREQWLTHLAGLIESLFKGYHLPKYRVTCGWPCRGGLNEKFPAVGECHGARSSPDGVHEIFISPVLGKEDALNVAGTLCHEMAHVAAGIKAQHGREFKKVCLHVGLTRGPVRSAAPGDLLEDRLADMMDSMGCRYPHSGMVVPVKRSKKVSTVIGVSCVCGEKVNIARAWLGRGGVLYCGCGERMCTYEQ